MALTDLHLLSASDATRLIREGAKLVETNFVRADLRKADLTGVTVNGANFRDAKLQDAILTTARLGAASFVGTDLRKANLVDADLSYCRFIESNLEGADLTGSRVYGISAWNLELSDASQNDLIITRESEPTITVDNLEIAQFIYLLLNHKKLRDAINSVTERGVLILGRFRKGGLTILRSIADKLRTEGYLPIIFDFDKPQARNFTETVKTLTGLSRFVIGQTQIPYTTAAEQFATWRRAGS
jgi:hypothetical protein